MRYLSFITINIMSNISSRTSHSQVEAGISIDWSKEYMNLLLLLIYCILFAHSYLEVLGKSFQFVFGFVLLALFESPDENIFF